MTVQTVGLIMESDAKQEGTADKQVELTSNKHEQPETFMSEALLQKIDRPREMNIGKHVPLPQLVVVGDQSSGKSSLLESLTGIPFPSRSGLCTRYATQITQRRDSQSRVNISIIPGSDASEAHKEHVEGYFHAKFPQILQDYAEYERREEVLNDKPWSSLPRDRVGVRPLKARLRELLVHIAQQEFSSLRKDIGRVLHAANQGQEELGPSRKNEQEQRMYLVGIARKFEELVWAGLDAQYSKHSVFKKNLQLRLVTLVIYLSETFGEALEKNRHLRNFEDMGSNTKDNKFPRQVMTANGKASDDMRSALEALDADDFPDLDNIVSHSYEAEPHKTTSWSGSRVFVVAIHCFITSMLEDVCDDNRVREELWSAILEEVLKRYKAAMEHVSFLMSVERKKRPYTLNAYVYFNEHRQSARGNRMAELLEVDSLYDDSYKAEQIRTAMKKQSNTEYATAEIYDLLGSYYEEWVMGLFTDQLKAIADESPSVKERRDMLDKKTKDLRAAKETLRH
ncbi:hypothetical protein B0T26DRAFT_746818 [Lasiosphaeria miniovina]|uniref:Dynamin N-terminal domain-containing protein n=1 Tax=Lasiosphaeria miniovina TaxID=1954250 RepID=A0AA40BIS1_9PEZI|nr:uncharacterized protein B0T26DRAFT_746818 [Lasiosphaeria miniovina]KAK0734984.1 hypothetical protein B0T26DRAFT_746818 [Lasiosphaeria miniovina]